MDSGSGSGGGSGIREPKFLDLKVLRTEFWAEGSRPLEFESKLFKRCYHVLRTTLPHNIQQKDACQHA
jgi:hypothetical protein